MLRHQFDEVRRGLPITLVLVLLAVGLPGLVPAADEDSVADDPTLAMARTQFRERWLVGDHASLARLLADDGAIISLARDDRVARSTSPSRAHYLFQALFRSTSRHVLETVAVSDGATGEIVHTVLDWFYLSDGIEQSDRLFVTWVRTRSGWRLAELRTGR